MENRELASDRSLFNIDTGSANHLAYWDFLPSTYSSILKSKAQLFSILASKRSSASLSVCLYPALKIQNFGGCMQFNDFTKELADL